MPCADSRVDINGFEQMQRLNRATRLLCFTLRHLENQGTWPTATAPEDEALQSDLAAWWEEHKQDDENT